MDNVPPQTAILRKREIYSPINLRSYDKERHISVDDAYKLLKNQKDRSLSQKKLRYAINQGEIRVYEFDEVQYLDRLDIGRVYHKVPETRQGMNIERYFTKEGEDPFASVGDYKTRHLQIKDVDGDVIFDMPDTKFPISWSENAARIVAEKYFFRPKDENWRKNGCPGWGYREGPLCWNSGRWHPVRLVP